MYIIVLHSLFIDATVLCFPSARKRLMYGNSSQTSGTAASNSVKRAAGSQELRVAQRLCSQVDGTELCVAIPLN